jgi:hypothetical protein
MSIGCPDEEKLKSLIRESFDDLIGPDTARLGQIGARLGKQARRSETRRTRGRHWLFWLLLGTAVTATAWWAIKEIQRNGPDADIEVTAPVVVLKSAPVEESVQLPATPAQDVTDGHEQQNKHQPDADKESSVIYQRELY